MPAAVCAADAAMAAAAATDAGAAAAQEDEAAAGASGAFSRLCLGHRPVYARYFHADEDEEDADTNQKLKVRCCVGACLVIFTPFLTGSLGLVAEQEEGCGAARPWLLAAAPGRVGRRGRRRPAARRKG